MVGNNIHRELVQQDIEKVSALLLTSSFEGFPMTLLEALSWGIPCISADCVSGPADIIQPDVNGHLYQPGDIAGFVTLLNKYIAGEIHIEHEKFLRRSMNFTNRSITIDYIR